MKIMAIGESYTGTDIDPMPGTTILTPPGDYQREILDCISVNGGVVFGSPNSIKGANLGSGCLVLRSTSWTKKVVDIEYECWLIDNSLKKSGVKVKRTPGKTAIDYFKSFWLTKDPNWFKKNFSYSLPPKYRAICDDAIHSGPLMHCYSGSEFCTHIDRNEAFLDSMRKVLPYSGRWRVVSNPTFEKMIKLANMKNMCMIVDAEVQVDSFVFPPLPVRTFNGKMVYPYGLVKGVWPWPILKVAIEVYGCEVVKINSVIVCKGETRPEFADSISEMEKRARKALYTKIWGKFCSKGSYEGSLIKPDDKYFTTKQYGHKIYWTDASIGQFSGAPWNYRPDMSAYITAHNHAEVMRVAAEYDVIASHVDSLFVQGPLKTGGHEGWSVKGMGSCRYYAQGRYSVYDIRKKKRYYGFQGKPPNVKSKQFEEWAAMIEDNLDGSRVWDKNPASNKDASSKPRFKNHPRFRSGIYPEAAKWSVNGNKVK
jgi:hypothetical protein